MMPWKRYAVYYTATGALADFGAAWLGWDIAKGQHCAHPQHTGLLPEEISRITQTPRRYGFHATLKPPFRLHTDTTEAALTDDLIRMASGLPPVSLPGGLRLMLLHGFPALCPVVPNDDLSALAARLVCDLDHHRAPLTRQERERRNPGKLTERQCYYLDQWGYPWVMDEFRFHMTLGGALPSAEAAQCVAALCPAITPLLPDPHIIDAVTLVGEDTEGYCHTIKRIVLTG